MSSDTIPTTKETLESHELEHIESSIVEQNSENLTAVKEHVKEAAQTVKRFFQPNTEEGNCATDQGKTSENVPLIEKEDLGDGAASANDAPETVAAAAPAEATPSGHAAKESIADNLREAVIEKPAKYLSEKASQFNEKLIAGFDYVGSHLDGMTRCMAAPSSPDAAADAGDDVAGGKADDGHGHHHSSGPVAIAEKIVETLIEKPAAACTEASVEINEKASGFNKKMIAGFDYVGDKLVGAATTVANATRAMVGGTAHTATDTAGAVSGEGAGEKAKLLQEGEASEAESTK
ncbi:hypothetical protein Vretimale_2162 [Volvox reticuliferus]|uniref:Uncharacterized protein n=1 Tax=Volvox reticuliferus TaxID=1737510 RepID=A0A8J4C9K4_9CHLO|nr:hypothetical protein Vretifemale_4548 [Volvox reticuliferus]GIL96449.1 hypothetical protein Vretimale_2162 [Volvox reticuliferus]